MADEPLTKIDSLQDLIRELAICYSDLKEGRIEVPVACEMNNCAGKIINSAKLQLEYEKMVENGMPKVEFMNTISGNQKQIVGKSKKK